MSLIIEGINIPGKEKTPLNFTVWSDGTVYCRDVTKKITKVRAIQIPEDHGRIGDLDELQKAIRTDIMGGLNYEHFIRNAPTILEPEDECKRCKHKGDEYWCRDAYEDDEGKCSIYEPYGGIE